MEQPLELVEVMVQLGLEPEPARQQRQFVVPLEKVLVLVLTEPIVMLRHYQIGFVAEPLVLQQLKLMTRQVVLVLVMELPLEPLELVLTML
jgi:hypothetical protein